MEKEAPINQDILKELPILRNISVLETIKCASGNHGSMVCCKNGCKHYPFMCGDRKCVCRRNHQNCMIKAQVLEFIEKFENRIINLSSLINFHDSQIEKTIKIFSLQMNQLKNLFRQQISEKLRVLSFSEKDLEFLMKIQQNKVQGMKGEDFFKVYQDLNLERENNTKFNEEKQVKAIKSKWKNIQRKILDQIQNIQKLWKQNKKKSSFYDEQNIEKQKDQNDEQIKNTNEQQLQLSEEKINLDKQKQKINNQKMQQQLQLAKGKNSSDEQKQKLKKQQIQQELQLAEGKIKLDKQKQKLKNEPFQEQLKSFNYKEQEKNNIDKKKIEQDKSDLEKQENQQMKQQEFANIEQCQLMKSTIITSTNECQNIFNFFGNKKVQITFNIKYRASENNFERYMFRENAYTIKNTLILVKTEQDKIIGGFANNQWTKNHHYHHAPYYCHHCHPCYHPCNYNHYYNPPCNCYNDCSYAQYIADTSNSTFLFSLTNNDKLQINHKSAGIINNPHYGPAFGYQNSKFLFIGGDQNISFVFLEMLLLIPTIRKITNKPTKDLLEAQHQNLKQNNGKCGKQYLNDGPSLICDLINLIRDQINLHDLYVYLFQTIEIYDSFRCLNVQILKLTQYYECLSILLLSFRFSKVEFSRIFNSFLSQLTINPNNQQEQQQLPKYIILINKSTIIGYLREPSD